MRLAFPAQRVKDRCEIVSDWIHPDPRRRTPRPAMARLPSNRTKGQPTIPGEYEPTGIAHRLSEATRSLYVVEAQYAPRRGQRPFSTVARP